LDGQKGVLKCPPEGTKQVIYEFVGEGGKGKNEEGRGKQGARLLQTTLYEKGTHNT